MEDGKETGVLGSGPCMMCQDPTDSLFECANVVYVGIPHGHQLLRVVMAVLHNTHTGLSRFKLLGKNRCQFGSDTSGGPGGSGILLMVCAEALQFKPFRLCCLFSALFQAEGIPTGVDAHG